MDEGQNCLSARQALILERSVGDYVRKGRPITSEYLYRKYEFGIRPAMIRRELSALGARDYLMQIHPSGGRIPTHKAYRFLINVLENREERRGGVRYASEMVSMVRDGALEVLAKALSDRLRLLSVVYEWESDAIYNSGLDSLCRSRDLKDKGTILEVIRDFEMLHSRLASARGLWEENKRWPVFFVGSNELTESDALSVAAGRVKAGRYGAVIVAIGPVRMDYGAVMDTFRALDV